MSGERVFKTYPTHAQLAEAEAGKARLEAALARLADIG